MEYNSAISVTRLAKIIDVHKNTLRAWLCHYSLSKHVYYDVDYYSRIIPMFRISKQSLNALRKYLSKKNRKYLIGIDEVFPL